MKSQSCIVSLLIVTLVALLSGCGGPTSAPVVSKPAAKPAATASKAAPVNKAAPAANVAVGPRDAAFMPLGVYWAGEYLYATNNAIDWSLVDRDLDALARHHVNAIWLTHRSAAETAEFARHAAKRGIYVVASIAELAGEVENVRKADHPALIANTLAAWGDAPKPVAWGLGDEPRADYMGEIAAYVKSWRQHAPGEPLTTVVMHGDVTAAAAVGFDALCADIYPYFSGGNPNNYGMADWAAWMVNVQKLRQASRRPWMMGQSYQEPWGPFEVSPEGNIVYLPGGAPHWVMPTPAQMSWQALSAVAGGAKGMFYFLYRWPTGSNLAGAPANLPAAVSVRTDSGAPKGLVYPDGRSTPQYEAVGEAFGWINRFAGVLAPLQPATVSEAWEDGAAGGNVVSVLVDPKSGKRYLMVVSNAEVPVKVTLGSHITALTDLATGKALPLASAAPFRRATVALAPGTAALFACTVDDTNLPKSYGDDFTSDKFMTDARTVQAVQRFGDGVLSASGGQSYEQAFVVYDLETLLPALPAGGFRMLMYDSAASPPDFRGTFWSMSTDGQTFEKLSYNEPGKPVFFSARYLKVGLCWSQSSAAWAYGCLKRFNVVQWNQAAKQGAAAP